MKKIVHIITSLGDGGAEALLCRLCISLESSQQNHIVISLKDFGKYGAILHKSNVLVYSLNIQSLVSVFCGVFRLVRLLRRIKPNVVQTWMYHADFFGGICAKLAGVKHIVWGIHNTTLEKGKSSLKTIILVKLLTPLSYLIPSKIVCCANSAFEYHKSIGYDVSKLVVILNGYDTNHFSPSNYIRYKTRKLLKISKSEILLGMVARNSPQKDYPCLLKALGIVRKTIKFRCLIVGFGVENLQKDVIQNDLSNCVTLLPALNDIKLIYNALDILVLSSAYGEALPNVVAEAMSCCIPCVVTDVGDSKNIIRGCGMCVRPKDPQSLADAILALIKIKTNTNTNGWLTLRVAARQRIIDEYSFDKMQLAYLRIWNL